VVEDAAMPPGGVHPNRAAAVQASTQSAKSLHVTSVRPSRHSAVGVVQYQTSSQYSVSSAWKMSQWSGLDASSQDLLLPGASPKYSAIWMLIGADVMWFTNRYEQLMLAVLELIIQVSDQPVAPSIGLVTSTGTSAPWRTLAMTCQVVPMTVLPFVNESICYV
jgi:uncharacterized membrane protein